MPEQQELRRIKVWDSATRLFHWLLLVLVGFSWLSVEMGWMTWHLYSGCAIGALLLFRLAWGFVGSETARFTQFLASPFAAARHLLHMRVREPDEAVGHNAAGGWMVLIMLALLVVQVLTGLASNDDVSFEGPLAHYAGKALSDGLSIAHSVIFTLIQVAVAAHVVAILLYWVLKRQNLVGPMLHGHKFLPIDTAAPRLVHPLRALLILAVAGAAMAWVAFRL